jgi:hypothetical protein
MKRIILSVLSLLILVFGMCFVVIYAEDFQLKEQTNEVNNMRQVEQKIPNREQDYQPALDAALKFLAIPEGYELKDVRNGKQNEADVWVFRYEKANGENNGLGGEHYSFTVDNESHKILGFTWMDQRFASGQKLPSEKRTEEIAKSFLDWVEPGLINKLENLWIKPHDEVIKVVSEEVTITGMKYKCYLKDQDTYAWVIVGPNEKIITFEQGIKWEGGRVTEKWLHDSWLVGR